MIDSHSLTAKLMRLPLRLLKPGAVLPILSGCLRGTKWIMDAGDRSCWLGTYQREKQAIFSQKISPANIVFDIGGGTGFFSLLASKLVRQDGKVFVFESLPHHLNYLRMHLELNRSRNVTVIEAMASYKNDFTAAEPFSSTGQSQVKTYTLDSLLEHGQIPVPDLIHMNLSEGAFAALCGAKSLISKTRPTLILSIYEDVPRRESCAFLEMLDYHLKPADGKLLEESNLIVAGHI